MPLLTPRQLNRQLGRLPEVDRTRYGALNALRFLLAHQGHPDPENAVLSIAHNAPNATDYYSTKALSAAEWDRMGGRAMFGVIDPKDFEAVASPLGNLVDYSKLRNLQQLWDQRNPTTGVGLRAMPELGTDVVQLGPRRVSALEAILHDGRHRNRTMTDNWERSSLIQLPLYSDENLTHGTKDLQRQLWMNPRTVLLPEKYSPSELGLELRHERQFGYDPDVYPRPPVRVGDWLQRTPWRTGGAVRNT